MTSIIIRSLSSISLSVKLCLACHIHNINHRETSALRRINFWPQAHRLWAAYKFIRTWLALFASVINHSTSLNVWRSARTSRVQTLVLYFNIHCRVSLARMPIWLSLNTVVRHVLQHVNLQNVAGSRLLFTILEMNIQYLWIYLN